MMMMMMMMTSSVTVTLVSLRNLLYINPGEIQTKVARNGINRAKESFIRFQLKTIIVVCYILQQYHQCSWCVISSSKYLYHIHILFFSW
jgi:hypothetical protein